MSGIASVFEEVLGEAPGRSVVARQPGVTMNASVDGPRHRTRFRTKYDAASLENGLDGWTPALGSADTDLNGELPAIAARAIDLVRNDAMVHSAARTTLDHVVGAGLKLQPMPDYTLLKRDYDWAEQWAADVGAKFRTWWNTKDCHAGGTLDGAGMTRQIFWEYWVRGDAVALPLWLPGEGMSQWSTRMSLVDATRLRNPFGVGDGMLENGNRIRSGVESNAYGRPVAYHLLQGHPAEAANMFDMSGMKCERVPAFTPKGRKRVIHTYRPDRIGQTRGVSALTSIVANAKGLKDYATAEIRAAVVNAMVAAFTETPMDIDFIKEMFGGDDDAAENWLAERNEYRVAMKAGAVIPLFPGEKLSSFATNRPNAAFGPFIDAAMHQFCAGVDLPRELLLKDFSNTNYSSARAALLEAWRGFVTSRDWLAGAWLQECYLLWLEEAVRLGEVEAPRFYENWFAYSRATWLGSGMIHIDPLKEAQSQVLKLQYNLSTYQEYYSGQGQDWREQLRQRARENEFCDELGHPEFKIAPPAGPLVTDGTYPSDDEEKPSKSGKDKPDALPAPVPDVPERKKPELPVPSKPTKPKAKAA
jgi:lambda family phage portal protein